MKNKEEITLVIPCYNEETNIQKGVLDKIGNFTHDNKQIIEVLIIDDGSTDTSRAIIQDRYLRQFPKFKLIQNDHQGKAFAIITGIREAKSNYAIFCDMDLATPLEETEKLVREIRNGYEIVIGSRNTHREGAPLIRKIQSLGFIFLRNVLIGLHGIRDTQCGFKLFEKKAAIDTINDLQIFKNGKAIHGSSVSAAFDLEFLFLASRKGYRIKEVPVEWRHVETKNVHFIKDAIESIQDLLRIKYYSISGRYNTNGKN